MTTSRLDLQPAFAQLEACLMDLRRMASIAETVSDDALKPADALACRAALGSTSYVPIVMTMAQRDNLSFIIGHVADFARLAARRYGEAVECTLEGGA